MPISDNRQRVIFAYRAAHSSFGSKLMRCDQLSIIAKQYLGESYIFEVVEVPHTRRIRRQKQFARYCENAIVIFLKGAGATLHQEAIEKLQKVAQGICVDYVDSRISSKFFPYVDVHIAASFSGYKLIETALRTSGHQTAKKSAEIKHLVHHADPRIVPSTQPNIEKLDLVYLGDRKNTIIPDQVSGRIFIPTYGPTRNFESIISEVGCRNMHYCVRQKTDKMRKPFTKGFNAAAFSTNILVNRQVDDAEYYLGVDYPFLINSAEPDDIIEGIRRAEDLFGSTEWTQGLEIIRELQARSSPQQVATDLSEILRIFK